jgi:hypothetical protein
MTIAGERIYQIVTDGKYTVGYIDKVLPWVSAQFENNPTIVPDLIKVGNR